MNRCLYELKFPAPEVFFKKEFLERIYSIDRTKGEAFTIYAWDAINEEFQYYVKGYQFKTAWTFAYANNKEPRTCRIHSDMLEGHEERYKSKIGFNYLLQGSGIWNFYNPNKITKVDPELKTWGGYIKTDTDKTPFYTTEDPADQIYHAEENKAYLFNAGMPHSATSFGNRICVSLRITDLELKYTFDDAVEFLQDYLV